MSVGALTCVSWELKLGLNLDITRSTNELSHYIVFRCEVCETSIDKSHNRVN